MTTDSQGRALNTSGNLLRTPAGHLGSVQDFSLREVAARIRKAANSKQEARKVADELENKKRELEVQKARYDRDTAKINRDTAKLKKVTVQLGIISAILFIIYAYINFQSQKSMVSGDASHTHVQLTEQVDGASPFSETASTEALSSALLQCYEIYGDLRNLTLGEIDFLLATRLEIEKYFPDAKPRAFVSVESKGGKKVMVYINATSSINARGSIAEMLRQYTEFKRQWWNIHEASYGKSIEIRLGTGP